MKPKSFVPLHTAKKEPQQQPKHPPHGKPITPEVLTDKEIKLPPHPVIPQTVTGLDHGQENLNSYHTNKGWFWGAWAQENRTRFAELLAEQQGHLLRIQQLTNAIEIEVYLRKHHLWTHEVAAVLQAETAITNIVQQRDARTKIQNQAKLDEAATTDLLTVDIFLERKKITFQTDEDLRAEKARSEIKIAETRKQEELKFEMEQKGIEAETKGAIDLHSVDIIVRERSVKQLRQLNLELIAIRRNLDITEEERQVEMRTLYREIDRLDKELYPNEQGGMAGKEIAGDDPEGGSTPPKSGNDPSALKRKVDKSPTSTHSRNVN